MTANVKNAAAQNFAPRQKFYFLFCKSAFQPLVANIALSGLFTNKSSSLNALPSRFAAKFAAVSPPIHATIWNTIKSTAIGHGNKESRAEYSVYYFEHYVVNLNDALDNLYDYNSHNLHYNKEHDGKHNPVDINIGKENTHAALFAQPVVEVAEKIAHYVPIQHEAEYQIADKY